jgi:hypothetical protein
MEGLSEILVTISDVLTAGGYFVNYANPIMGSEATIALVSLFGLSKTGFIDTCYEYGDTRYTVHVIKYLCSPHWFVIPQYGIVVDLDDATVAVQLKLIL